MSIFSNRQWFKRNWQGQEAVQCVPLFSIVPIPKTHDSLIYLHMLSSKLNFYIFLKTKTKGTSVRGHLSTIKIHFKNEISQKF